MREDDFSLTTKRALAARVGHVCSCPDCRAPTSGPQLEPEKAVTAGDAAHITAASPNGPRFDPSLTSEERCDYTNGIWLCVTHARIVDQDKSRYTVEELRRWKADAEAEAQKKLGRPQVSSEGRGVSSGTAESRPNDRKMRITHIRDSSSNGDVHTYWLSISFTNNSPTKQGGFVLELLFPTEIPVLPSTEYELAADGVTIETMRYRMLTLQSSDTIYRGQTIQIVDRARNPLSYKMNRALYYSDTRIGWNFRCNFFAGDLPIVRELIPWDEMHEF